MFPETRTILFLSRRSSTWSSGINLLVQEDTIGGNTIYENGVSTGGSYTPPHQHVYLGANNQGICEEEGSWPGLTYRNVWVGNVRGPSRSVMLSISG